MRKKMYRSASNRMIGGVLGGLGEYFDVDPTLFRLGFIILALVTAVLPCLLGYFLAFLIIPEQKV
ncbi:PspC domain-containing protein [Sporolactobacillus sp. THM7-4]|nr:PspC domain-containing protein [Sporolactobacillus sp. THM7-4]